MYAEAEGRRGGTEAREDDKLVGSAAVDGLEVRDFRLMGLPVVGWSEMSSRCLCPSLPCWCCCCRLLSSENMAPVWKARRSDSGGGRAHWAWRATESDDPTLAGY